MNYMKKAKWVKAKSTYGPSKLILVLGPHHVGTVHYDGLLTAGDKNVYAAKCSLPGVLDLGHYETEGMAQKKVWDAVEKWLWVVLED